MSEDKKDLKDSQVQTEEETLEARLRKMNEDVEIPDSLKPENVERQLRRKGDKKLFKWSIAHTACAAAVFCMIVIGIATYGAGKGQSKEHAGNQGQAASGKGGSIVQAKDYDEIYTYIQSEDRYIQNIMEFGRVTASEEGGASVPSGNAEQGMGHSDTNVRQEGVEEGDTVKTDGENLYILNYHNNTVAIVNIQNETMSPEGVIEFKEDERISEIYIKDKRLMVLYTKSQEDSDSRGHVRYQSFTVAETFDVTTPEQPRSIGRIEQSGDFHTLRVSGQYVYVLSTFSVYTEVGREEIEAYIPQAGGNALESENILLPQYEGGGQYTVISTFSMNEPDKKIDSKAILGSRGLVYVSENNIYVCESYYNTQESEVTKTLIRKVEYKDGELKAIGQTKIDGTLNDSFSIDEFEGNLRLVTTISTTGMGGAVPIVYRGDEPTLNEGPTPDDEKKDSNTLYILDPTLNKLSAIEGLAEDERVYSARLMGEAGYFVTFKQIDPLFSVDLSDPKNPKILGELKIPGFSNYLHPYGENMILGIGMESDETNTTVEGVKLSMFDISDPSDVKETDKHVLRDCFSTNVAHDYRAALISKERNIIAFSGYGEKQHFYVFSYDEKEGFTTLLDRELGFTQSRGVYAGNTLYIVSDNTIESYSLETFEKIDDIVI